MEVVLTTLLILVQLRKSWLVSSSIIIHWSSRSLPSVADVVLWSIARASVGCVACTLMFCGDSHKWFVALVFCPGSGFEGHDEVGHRPVSSTHSLFRCFLHEGCVPLCFEPSIYSLLFSLLIIPFCFGKSSLFFHAPYTHDDLFIGKQN